MNNDTNNQKPKYPIDLPVIVFPALIALVALIAIAYAALVISLTVKFALPAAAGLSTIFITGIPLCIYCYYNAIAKWQIWAYNSVNDIRELDSMQYLLPELCIENYNDKEFWMSKKDIAARKAILEKYYGPYQFSDDINIPNETVVSDVWMGSLSHNHGNLILSNEGIESPNGTFFRWEHIKDEDVFIENAGSSQKRYILSYKVPGDHIRLPLNKLGINYLKLKHVLYVYRARYEYTIQKVENTEGENIKQQYINKPVSYREDSTLWHVLIMTTYKFLKLPLLIRALIAIFLFFFCVAEFV